MTEVAREYRTLRTLANVHSFATTEAARVAVVRCVQRYLDTRSGLTESGKFALWSSVLRGVRAA